MRRIVLTSLLAIATVFASVTVASAGGGGHGGACRAFAEAATIVLRDSCIEGVAHTVAVGTPVSVRNDGELAHDLTAIDGSFATGTLSPGETTTLRIDEPGRYLVHCTLHGTTDGVGMAGVVDARAPEELEPAAATGTTGDAAWSVALVLVAAGGFVLGRVAARRRVRS